MTNWFERAPRSKDIKLKKFWCIVAKNRAIRAIFTPHKLEVMNLDWWPFYVVISLFILAIVAPWVFPNNRVSKNKHDNKF
jgi:hypothetical protein